MNSKAIGYGLIVLVLLIEIPRFYGTYADLDPLILGLPLTAIGTGIVLPVGAGYVFHAWWKTTRKRRDWLLIAFVVLLVLEGIILVPWGMARLQAEPLAQVVGSGPLAWGWVTVVMLSPFVMIGAVVMAVAFQAEKRAQGQRKPTQDVEAAAHHLEAATKTAQVQRLAELHPTWTRAQLAQEAGCSPSTVTRALQNGNHRHEPQAQEIEA